MIIMGLSAFNQASSCALFKNGELLACLFEENLSHIKGDSRFPFMSTRELLFHFDLIIDDIGLICFADDPVKNIQDHLSNPYMVAKLKKNFLDLESYIRNDLGFKKELCFVEKEKTHIQGRPDSIGACSVIYNERFNKQLHLNPKRSLNFLGPHCLGDFEKFFKVLDWNLVADILEKSGTCALYQGTIPYDISCLSFILSLHLGEPVNGSVLSTLQNLLPELKAKSFLGPEGILVTHPYEALDAFLRSDHELLIIGDRLLQKSDIPHDLLRLYRSVLKVKRRSNEDHP